MIQINIPFLRRGGFLLWGPSEGILYMQGALAARVIPSANRLKTIRNEKGFAAYLKERVRMFWNELVRGDAYAQGVICKRVVTTAGVNYLAADFAGGASDINAFKYHGSGTGTGSEVVGDTTLGTEIGTRATGNQNATNNQYTTVGTVSYTNTYAITEHGIFSAASNGTLWDRSVFSAINVVNGDSIEFTYTLTCNSGG